MKKIYAPLVLLAASLLVPPPPRAAARQAALDDLCGGRPCVHIGTFNIRYLGRPGRTSTDIADIARLISTKLNYEVVVLEEINVNSQDYTRLTQALPNYKFLHGETGDEQRVVIAYEKNRVTLVGQKMDIGERRRDTCEEEDPDKILRNPSAARFRAGNFNFIVVGVHLKSQRHGQCSDDLRFEQAEELGELIESDAFFTGVSDIIITGDFNKGYSHASLQPLRDRGFTSLTRGDRRSLTPPSNANSYLSVGGYPPELIDHLMVRINQTTEWVGRSTFIYTPTAAENYVPRISDHAPVRASFRTDL